MAEDRSAGTMIAPLRLRPLLAGSRASPCAPKAALGKSGIGEGPLCDAYSEGQPSATASRSPSLDNGLSRGCSATEPCRTTYGNTSATAVGGRRHLVGPSRLLWSSKAATAVRPSRNSLPNLVSTSNARQAANEASRAVVPSGSFLTVLEQMLSACRRVRLYWSV